MTGYPLGDLTGNQYSRLLVVDYYGRIKGKKAWNCLCDCGNKTAVIQEHLRSGNTRSCGCLQREHARHIPNHYIKHGYAANGNRIPEYERWQSMKQRCLNANNEAFYLYGGRGITVCDRWLNSFENFLSDMGSRPTPRHTLERRENSGNYEPLNCYWATPKQQALNRRTNRFLTANGKTLCISQWSEALGWPFNVISGRLHRGWSEYDAVNIPLLRRGERKPMGLQC